MLIVVDLFDASHFRLFNAVFQKGMQKGSRAHQEITATIQCPPRNDSKHGEPNQSNIQRNFINTYTTGKTISGAYGAETFRHSDVLRVYLDPEIISYCCSTFAASSKKKK